MDKTIVEAQMVHHLKNIQKLTQSVLVQFKESGVTIDGDFIKYFLKLSIERYDLFKLLLIEKKSLDSVFTMS